MTDLWATLHEGCIETVRSLLMDGADINAKITDDGDTPLLLAAQHNHPNIVELLIRAGANINFCNKRGWTVLHYASQNGWITVARSLVEHGADVNAELTDCGNTPLLLATTHNHPDIIELLISAGANTNCYNKCGWTVLHYASHKGFFEIAQSFVKQGIDVNCKNTPLTCTPLMLAVLFKHLDIAELLISAGANINSCNEQGWTALHYASYFSWDGWITYFKNLMKIRMDVNAKANLVVPCVQFSTAGLSAKMFYQTIKERATAAKANHHERTMLNGASKKEWPAIIQSLVEKGADINAEAFNGLTPLSIACRINNLELVNYFLKVVAARNAEDDYKPSLYAFIKSSNAIFVKLFIANGAYLNSYVYNLILEKPLLKKDVLQNVGLCSKIIIDKFNNEDLPKMYELAKSADLPSIDLMRISYRSKVIHDVMQSVKHNIKLNGHCNILETRPIVLSMLAVKSFTNYCHLKKSEEALRKAKKDLANDLKRSAVFDTDTQQNPSKIMRLN